MKALLYHSALVFLYTSALLLLAARPHAQQHSLKLYNVNDGLPSPSILGACQDNYGYLWVSTTAGASRFDGRQFVNYSIADGLPSLAVGAFFQDSRDRLWVATTAGVAQFKSNKFVTYPASDKLMNAYAFNFFETKDKKIWALTQGGVYEFEENSWKKITLYPGFENAACRNVIEINGELFINYTTDIVCRNRAGKWINIAPHSFFNVMSLQHDKIWVSTGVNMYEIRNHGLVPVYKPNINSKGFFSYLIDSKKRVWIGHDNLLKNSAPNDWQHFSDSINNPGYYSFITEDSRHNIWTGTREGLLRVKDVNFEVIDKNNRAPLDGIYNIITLPDHRLLLSSGTKTGIIVYGSSFCRQLLPPQASANKNYYKDPVDAYGFDDKNTAWMMTRFKRFLHFNGKTLEDFSSALNLKTTENIYAMTYAKIRQKFFICADSTLLYGTSAKLAPFIPHNTGVPIVKPTRVHEMKNGLLLLYIDGKGIYCVNGNDDLISLIKETGIDGRNKGIQLAVTFWEDMDGNFWVAVPGLGLYEYGFTKNKAIYLKNHITISDGLQSANVLSITNDRENRIWIATNTGLDILQKNKTGTWEVFNYAKAEDLTINISDFEKLAADSDGNVWLSSPNKIIKFNTGKIRLHKQPPRIIIEKVALAFKETEWNKLSDSLYGYYQLPYRPALNYSQNSLGIFYNALDLSTANSNPVYSYKLLPLETAWSIPSKTKSVSFAQLPSGSYQFIVRAKDNASGWSSPAVFRFSITPPFWAEWWFRLTVIFIASLFIISIFRARIRKIKSDAFIENHLKELEMKALKAQMNPHFIYNALNSIQALVANEKKDEGIHYIGSFSRLLRQVLDNSENNVISLDKELETIGLYIQLESLRLDMQLQYKKNLPENIVLEFEKIPPLILQPFVENALWHGLSRKEGEKEITIAISLSGDWLICDITDNGIGREKAVEWKNNSVAIHQSKGIDITRKRLIDFNEDSLVSPIEFFDLYDDKNNAAGTQVKVHIKRKLNPPFV